MPGDTIFNIHVNYPNDVVDKRHENLIVKERVTNSA